MLTCSYAAAGSPRWRGRAPRWSALGLVDGTVESPNDACGEIIVPTQSESSDERDGVGAQGVDVASVTSRRYQYGSSFVDQASGVRFEGHHPLERPDLWRLYLDEAEGTYRNHGFEGTLRRRELDEGDGVSLFFIGFAPDGRAVAGVRVHGPLDGSYQAALVEEMADSPEIDEVAALIDREVRLGVVEIKGAWSKGEAGVGHRLVETLSRCVTHSLHWLGAELAVAAISDTLKPAGDITGATQIGTCWVPFPDERYRTISLSWRRSRSYELCTPTHQQNLRREAEQLGRGPAATGLVEDASERSRAWRAVVLDVGTRAQREVLRVLREDESLRMVDRLEEQREQLRDIIPTPHASLLTEGYRWVYYPWRRAVVRLLAPRSFSRLRLDRNHHKITLDEQSRLRTLRVGLVGVSAGHAIAHALAMEGLIGEIRLADFDVIDLSNLNRIPASVLDLGVNKAVVAARRIAEIDPYVRVVAVPEGVTPENLGAFLDGLDLVIEECDSLDVKFLVREAARERGVPVIMETSDRGVLDVERYDLEPARPIFHGLLGAMDSATLAGLSLAEKGPYLLRLVGAGEASARGAVSLLEVGTTLTGWPQLGSEITLGAATVAAAVRRLGTGATLASGRVRFDVEEILDGLAPVDVRDERLEGLVEPAPEDPPLVAGDPVEMVVDAARRAPSGGNVQPWRFEASGDEIRFYLLPERTSKMDVAHRGSYLGIGAAILNARVAAASLQRVGTVQLFPSSRVSDHVATLTLGAGLDADLARYHPYIASRSANRRIGEPTPVPLSVLQRWARSVSREGARLHVLAERDEIAEGAHLLAESDRLRFLIPDVHQQMLHELRWPGLDDLDEGLDVRALEMDETALGALDLLGRPDVMALLERWGGGQALGTRTRVAVATSSALVAIVVPRAEPAWYVRAGMALERLWLNVERDGLAAQPVSPIFLYVTNERELRELGGERHVRDLSDLARAFSELWDLADGEVVAMVMRVFDAPPPRVHSVRRSIDEVLSRDETSTSVLELSRTLDV